MKSFVLFSIVVSIMFTQNLGTINGKISDSNNGDELISANVQVDGTSYGAASDIDGTFSIQLPAGEYSLTISYVSYQNKTFKNVVVNANQITNLNISLAPEELSSEEVIVEAKLVENNVNALIITQKKSTKVIDAISAEQIKKSTDSDVGSALKRVTGLTVVDGKNVYVRGLGNRYSNVQLNGSTVPSTNPNQKEVPLDIFPSNVLDNIIVQKTYTADQSGEFSGGSVQIETKNFVEGNFLQISVGNGYNSNSSFVNAVDHQGGDFDFIGFDDGSRSMPDYIEKLDRVSENDVNALNSFNNNYLTKKSSLLPAINIGISYGSELMIQGIPVGIVATLNQMYSNSYQDGQKNYLRSINASGEYSASSRYNFEKSSSTGKLTAMLNLAAKLSPNHTLSFKNLFTNQGKKSSAIYTGWFYNSGDDYYQTVLGFEQEQIISSSVRSEMFIESLNHLKWNNEISYAMATRNEPDKRNIHYTIDNLNQKKLVMDQRSNYRFFSEQDDHNFEYKTSIELKPSYDLKFSIGSGILLKDRDFYARKFIFGAQTANTLNKSLAPDQLFVATQISNGLKFYESTTATDRYTGEQMLSHVYLSTNYDLNKQFKINAGLRFEQSNQKIDGKSLVDNFDFLPALNMTYLMSEEMNLRFAYSHTLARPEFREISNFFFEDYVGGVIIYGNPDLKRTNIQNIDLRYEVFPGIGEMISVSAFMKFFENPIELFHRESQQAEIQYKNVPNASLYGFEFEYRQNLNEALTVSGNLSVIKSEVSYDGSNANTVASVANLSRPMYGQSPYTINLTGNYLINEDLEASLSFNTFGKRIAGVGTDSQGDDVYEMPFNKLDMTLNYKFNLFSFKFAMRNLLNSEKLLKQHDFIISKYKEGIDMSLSASYSF